MSGALTIGLIGGTGKEGRGLAVRLARAGFGVVIGSRKAERARAVVSSLRDRWGDLQVDGEANAEVIKRCQVMALTVPYEHAASTLDVHREAFRTGSLVIDVTVPVSFEGGRPRFVEPPQGSGAEQLRQHLPEAVGLAAALKTVPAYLLEKPDAPLDCDVFVCGDSATSRRRTMEILGRISGLRPIDVGDLEASRTLERMSVLLIGINRRHKIHGGRFRLLGLESRSTLVTS